MKSFSTLSSVLFSTLAWICLSTLTGCASAKKEQCEKEDWTNYGASIAQRGQVWESEGYLGECRKEGITPNLDAIRKGYTQGARAFCNGALFYSAGKEGEPRSASICPSEQQAKLKKEHERGVQAHCTKQGAFLRGKSGRPNPKLCPEKLAGSYEYHYQQGRIAFLRADIGIKEKRLFDLEQRTTAIDREIAEAERKVPRYQYLTAKNDKSTTESIEFLAMENPERKISDRNEEKTRLQKEHEEVSSLVQNLKAELSLLESQSVQAPTGELEARK
jgi:hypothetical protein